MGQIPLYIEIYRSTADQRKKHMLKRTRGLQLTTLSLTIPVYLQSFSC